MDDNELDRLFGEVSESGSKPENVPSKDKEKEPSDKEAGDSERAEEVLRKNGFIISKYEESSGDDEDGTDEDPSDDEETEGSEDAEEGADSEENDEEGDGRCRRGCCAVAGSQTVARLAWSRSALHRSLRIRLRQDGSEADS